MKVKSLSRILAVVLCLMLIVSCVPFQASAETITETVSMTEGDVIKEFAAADAECVSSNPDVAWVDNDGSLNALKTGTATITVVNGDDTTEYTVTVSDYTDGSAVAGNLKILARFNDSMQFYDGHVYLIFTSYQDGVTINVPDLYAAYTIDDQYYKDINEDIANGSNHTDKNTDKYFTFSDSTKSVTLNRGEVVTIGMYRDFDLSVPQAALGSIKNSSAWTTLEKAGKAATVETIFKFLDSHVIDAYQAVEKLKAAFDEVGLDYNKALDGVVDGGVCFNRELYNQKLEWDQFENVTYDLDITRNQLNLMTMYLGGNNGKFSILKNSCATVALRAWNAAVGTRNGEDTAYKLTSVSDGIFEFIDAPKGVRDNIVKRLPGYYLNNANGIAEPDAGFVDDTGYVYVTAPKKVTPVNYVYADDTFTVDESRTKLADLMNAAKGDKVIDYNKDEQTVNISVNVSGGGNRGIISGVTFEVNGQTFAADGNTALKDGVWFKTKVPAAEGVNYYVTNGTKVLPSVYEDGYISFKDDVLPSNFVIMSSSDEAKNVLNTVIVNGDNLSPTTKTEVYYKNGDNKVMLDASGEVPAGTKVFVKSTIGKSEYSYILTDVALNGESFFNEDSFDSEEGAYFAVMPSKYSTLTAKYDKALLTATKRDLIQIEAGETIDAADFAELTVNGSPVEGKVVWTAFDGSDAVEVNGSKLTALKAGKAMVLASCEANDNISVIYDIEVYENAEDMVKFTFDDSSRETIYTYEDESGTAVIPYSGYLLEKGSEVTIIPVPEESKAVFWITANDSYVMPNEKLTVNTDTEVKVRYAEAEMTGMPKEIKLKAMGDTYQLKAETKYTGLLSFVAPYDQSITYVISDPVISVDENGLITVVGDIPEDGKVVYVTAYAGSSGNSVFARTKVTLGDYKGSRIVGKMTISSRRITEKEFMSHGCLTFTTYEDVDLNTSYYDYYRPDDRYNDLMVDYMKKPEKYTSDPAIYNDNDLGLEDRMSYFTTNPKGANSEPENISLVAGESITVSNYGFDPTNMIAIRRALEGSLYQDSKETQELVKQMNLYTEGSEEFDGAVAFDSLVDTLKQMFAVSGSMGYNPADGQSEGGMTINREIYNQFRRNDSQLPNNYYEVEITADELELMKSYLANPENNRYSLFNKNCASGAVDMWNTTLADRPEYKLTANYSTIATEPMSLYFELGQMANKNLDGKAGTDFVPHTVRYTDEIIDTIEKIKAIGEVELTDECKAKIDSAREAYDALIDGEKERVWNYDDLVNAENTYETLKKAKEDEELAKNIAAFEQYKSEQMTAARALLQEDDPIQCDFAVALAETLMLTTSYDSAKTLDENKAEIDSIMDTLKNDLDKIRHPEDPEPEVLIGDVNNDGVVDVMDSIMIQRFSTETVELTDDQKYAADVNNDGEVDIIDAMQIQKFTVEKLDEFEKKA